MQETPTVSKRCASPHMHFMLTQTIFGKEKGLTILEGCRIHRHARQFQQRRRVAQVERPPRQLAHLILLQQSALCKAMQRAKYLTLQSSLSQDNGMLL